MTEAQSKARPTPEAMQLMSKHISRNCIRRRPVPGPCLEKVVVTTLNEIHAATMKDKLRAWR